MRLRGLALPVAVLLTVVGCSDSDTGSAAEATQPTDGAADEPTVEPGNPASCTADYRTMQVAVETYLAIGGVEPVTEQQLVDEQLLRTEFDTFDLTVDGAATVVVATPGGACDGVELSDGESPCDVQRKVLEIGLEAYLANGGTLPVDEAGLINAGMIRVEFDDYDIDGELVVPVGDRCAGQ